MRTVRTTLALAALALTACAPAADPPPVQPTVDAGPPTPPSPPAPPAPPAPTVFDPVETGMTVAGVKALCDDHLKAAGDKLEQIRKLKSAGPEALTYDMTLGRFDAVISEIRNASEFPGLMAVAHPDKAVRDAAKLCEPAADKFLTSLYLDEAVATVIKTYAKKGEKLDTAKTRLLTETIRDFRRNGLELDEPGKKRLRELNAEITDLGQKFIINIGASKETLTLDAKQLDGLPADYVAKHPVKDGKVELTTDYPDYFPFVTYAKDRAAALKLYVLFTNRGGDENVKILETLLARRHEKAKLLGYGTWADYTIEPRMAKTAKTVADFLQKIRDAVKAPARGEMAELMREHVKAGGKATDKLPPVEGYYLQDRVKTAKYKFDSQELAKYFEMSAVTKGLLDITAKMYGLEYKTVPAKTWHPDVTAHEVWSKGKLIGMFYLDLYSRPDKYKHAAAFDVRAARRMEDGSYQLPKVALECNFPKPGGAGPALMSHGDVVTYFHEFGHVLHHVLTESELATYAGTSTVRDFVEAPSQMFEEWAYSREVLDLFAKHYETGAKIPAPLFAAMQKARPFGRAVETQRQVFLATLDQELHTRAVPIDSSKVVDEVRRANTAFVDVPGTHFQGSFGHLISYDAGYYSYQWALALSRDVLTRFKKEGLLNTETAASWRREVLAKGGGEDERTMVARFLGRESNEKAYIEYLQGKD
jgi:thimet oligopeptidase